MGGFCLSTPIMSSTPEIRQYFDTNTSTWTYLVIDATTKKCALIDTVLDYDAQSASVTTTSADKLLAILANEKLTLEWILETHVHADHLTASAYLKKAYMKANAGATAPKIAIGSHIKAVLAYWIPIFHMEKDPQCPADGSQFDVLFSDGDSFTIGSIIVKVLHTPGHTPACVSYVLDNGKIAFVGDTIFMPEVGTARTDFPGGSAATLYDSCRRLLSLMPADGLVYVGHDYPGGGKEPLSAATVAEHLKDNCMMNERVTKDEFVAANMEELPVPRLLLPSLQVNLRAGKLGPLVGSMKYIVLPINALNKNINPLLADL